MREQNGPSRRAASATTARTNPVDTDAPHRSASSRDTRAKVRNCAPRPDRRRTLTDLPTPAQHRHDLMLGDHHPRLGQLEDLPFTDARTPPRHAGPRRTPGSHTGPAGAPACDPARPPTPASTPTNPAVSPTPARPPTLRLRRPPTQPIRRRRLRRVRRVQLQPTHQTRRSPPAAAGCPHAATPPNPQLSKHPHQFLTREAATRAAHQDHASQHRHSG